MTVHQGGQDRGSSQPHSSFDLVASVQHRYATLAGNSLNTAGNLRYGFLSSRPSQRRRPLTADLARRVRAIRRNDATSARRDVSTSVQNVLGEPVLARGANALTPPDGIANLVGRRNNRSPESLKVLGYGRVDHSLDSLQVVLVLTSTPAPNVWRRALIECRGSRGGSCIAVKIPFETRNADQPSSANSNGRLELACACQTVDSLG